MGMIVEQIKESPERFVVIEDCTEVCYSPIFHREIAAMMFVAHIQGLNVSQRLGMDNTDKEIALASEIATFLEEVAPCGKRESSLSADKWAEFEGELRETLLVAQNSEEDLADMRESAAPNRVPYYCSEFISDVHSYEDAPFNRRCYHSNPMPILMNAFHQWQKSKTERREV